MRYARIFIDFAEQILAVDQLEPPAPERLEVETQPLELLLLQVGHQPDELGLVQAARIDEAFAQPVACPRAGHDEIHLAEIGELAVIDVGDE